MKGWKILFFLASASLFATDFPVSNAEELNDAIISVNAGVTADRILFNGNTILLFDGSFSAPNLRPLNSDDEFVAITRDITIEGPGTLTTSGSTFRGFFIHGSSPTTSPVTTINNINFSTLTARGGNGGTIEVDPTLTNQPGSGGGGAGLGGALFIGPAATVTLHNCNISSCAAVGGDGGNFIIVEGTVEKLGGSGGGGFAASGGSSGNLSGGGGGGLFFPGGNGNILITGGGGGGGGVNSAGELGGAMSGGEGGTNYTGGGGGTGGVSPTVDGGMGDSGAGGGGGVSDITEGGDGGEGGIGGGGGGAGGTRPSSMTTAGSTGGPGNDYSGGGGGGSLADDQPFVGSGGDCGIAGGGGGGGVRVTLVSGLRGGQGGSALSGGIGCGSGGGGSTTSPNGFNSSGGPTKGFGGAFGGPGLATTTGNNGGQGGGGAGFGGGIFVHQNAHLILTGTFALSGNSATGGTGGIDSTLGLGPDIFLMTNGRVTFNLDQNFVMPSPIEGNQGRILEGASSETVITAGIGLSKQGDFSLTLTGENTYTGTTLVEEGELSIEGSVTSDILVEIPGRLTGNFETKRELSGSFGGNIVNGGFFSPGSSDELTGEVLLEESFTNEPTGTVRVTITPQENVSDKIIPTDGSTILGGQLEVYIPTGTYIAGTQYEVILGPVTGTFDNQDNPTQVGPLAGQLTLSVESGSLIITVLDSVLFSNMLLPGIPTQVAECLVAEPIVPGSDIDFVIEQLNTLTPNQLNTALTSLSAVRFGSLEWINERSNSYVADLLSQHLLILCCSPRDCNSCNCNASFWITGYGNFMDNSDFYNNLPPFEADSGGGIFGLDVCFCNCWFIGAAFDYHRTDLDWEPEAGGGHINNYLGALYASWQCNCFALELTALGGASDYDLNRNLQFAEINRKAKSDFWGYFFTGRLGLRGRWVNCWRFEPLASVDYHYYHRDSFTESGADSIDLSVQDKTQHMLRAEAGILTGYEFDYECCCTFPYFGLSWVGEFPLHDSKQPASFVDSSCIIDALSYKSEQSLVVPQAGIKYTHCSGCSLLLNYKGLFNGKTCINQVNARLEWIF